MSWHSKLPWDWWRQTYLGMRSWLFSKPARDGPYVYVEATREEIIEALGKESYTPQRALSYDKGADINLARQYYERAGLEAERANLSGLVYDLTGGRLGQKTFESVQWWQTHIRGYEHEDGYMLTAHDEPSARHEDSAHIEGIGFSVRVGMTELKAILGKRGIPYQTDF